MDLIDTQYHRDLEEFDADRAQVRREPRDVVARQTTGNASAVLALRVMGQWIGQPAGEP